MAQLDEMQKTESVDETTPEQGVEAPVVSLWVFLLVLGIGLVTSIYFFNHFLKVERKAESSEAIYITLATQLSADSNYLTNAVREFVMTGNPNYLQDYWYEADIARGRDKIIEQLDQLSLPESEKALLITAKRNSDALMAIETRAMKLILLAINVPESDMYPPVRDYRLFPSDLALSATDKINLAQKLLFDPAYLKSKATVTDPITQFETEVTTRARQETTRARSHTDICFTVVTTFAVAILLLLFAIVWLRRGKLS